MAKKFFISGSTGLIGSTLVDFLRHQGNDVKRLVRKGSPMSKDAVFWDPEKGEVDSAALDGADVVINLAGESIMGLHWSQAKKKRIRDSRIQGTKNLCSVLSNLKQPPKVLINGSAIGYYGNRGTEELTEDSPSGTGFLAEVCQEWEAATQKAEEKGIRVVKLRTGIVLSSKGGALAQMLIPFKLGLGGVVGSGEQYMSWIALQDLVKMIDFAISQESIQGAINAVSPQPVTNAEFTKTLGSVLQRPTFLPLPAALARLIFGEVADEMLLCSTRAIPKKMQQAGFSFQYPDLFAALQTELSS